MHLLVVEDDPRLVRLLRRLLEEDRHVVETATDRSRRPRHRSRRRPGSSSSSSIIGLPDITGLEVARRLRATGLEVAILMLTARDTVGRPGDRARRGRRRLPRQAVRLRGAGGPAARARPARDDRRRRPEPKLEVGPDHARRDARLVTLDGKPIDLSPREFSLLECFLRHPGQALTRDQLLDQAWPFGVAVTPNAVDAYVHYLRDKLGAAGADRDRARRGLSSRRCLTGSSPDRDDARRTAPPRPPTAGWSGASGATSCCGAAGRRCSCCSRWASALYVAVAGSLANVRRRASSTRRIGRSSLRGQRPDPDDTSRYGFIFGGGGPGPSRSSLDPTRPRRPRPARPAAAARPARTTRRRGGRGRDGRTATSRRPTVGDDPGPGPDRDRRRARRRRPTRIQVVQDRTAEQQTLQMMLTVLLVGGGCVVLVVRSGSGRSTRGGRWCRSASR